VNEFKGNLDHYTSGIIWDLSSCDYFVLVRAVAIELYAQRITVLGKVGGIRKICGPKER